MELNATEFIVPGDFNISDVNFTELNLTEYALPDSFFDNDYVAPRFNNTYAITSLHVDTLRGDNINNISVMFLWTPEAASQLGQPAQELQKSYIVGVCISPILVIGFGIIWSLVLISIRMLGWKLKCLGCAAGKAFYYPLPPKSLEGKEIEPVLNASFGMRPSFLGDVTDAMDEIKDDLKKNIKNGTQKLHRGFTPNFESQNDQDIKEVHSSRIASNISKTLEVTNDNRKEEEETTAPRVEEDDKERALDNNTEREQGAPTKTPVIGDDLSQTKENAASKIIQENESSIIGESFHFSNRQSSTNESSKDESKQSGKGFNDSVEEYTEETAEKLLQEVLLEEERLSVGTKVKALVDELFWRARVERAQKRIQRTRTAFIYSGLISVTTCILFLLFPVRFISTSVNDIQRALSLTESATIRAINITESFIESANRTNAIVLQTFGSSDVSNFCNTTQNGTTFDEDTEAFLLQVEAVAQNVTSTLFQFNTYLMRQLTLLLGDLDFVLETIQQIQHYSTFTYWGFVVATVFICILIVFVVVLMAGAVSAFLQEQRVFWQCARSYILLPIMFVMLGIAWVFCTLFLVLGILLADFCFDSPDNNMYLILNNFRSQLGSLLYGLLLQYISGCTLGLGGQFGEVYRSIVSILFALTVLANNIRDARAEELATLCGVDKDVILNASGLLASALRQYLELFVGLGAIFNCGVWSPIYTAVTHDALCYNGTSGVLWGFVTVFVICISGLIMVCLRSAWQKVENADVVEKSPELSKKQEAIRRRIQTFKLRFGPFCSSIGRVPRGMVLLFQSGSCSCRNRCRKKKVNEGSADCDEQDQVDNRPPVVQTT